MSLNSFCNETSRTWVSLGPEISYANSCSSSTPLGMSSVPFLCDSFFFGTNRRNRWHPTPVLLPGKSHGQRSLVGCSPWDRRESDTTEWLHFHVLLSCIGEGNGNPLQYACLENSVDGGAWWATVHRVAKSRTRLSDFTFTFSKYYNIKKEGEAVWTLNLLICSISTLQPTQFLK